VAVTLPMFSLQQQQQQQQQQQCLHHSQFKVNAH
jgi:hypothetical protein